jgi:hypothetical protein
MNRSWSQLFKSAYRRETIPSFLITIGLVDALLGGVSGRPSLLAFGLGATGVTLLFRLWQAQTRAIDDLEQSPVLYLPDRPVRQPLVLDDSRRNSRRS